MLEGNAKVQCRIRAIAGSTVLKSKSEKKEVGSILSEVVQYMTTGKPKSDPLCKELHGAMTELGNSNGLLSVTSMNQLIHSTSFVVDETHICTVFSNIFPLLREMNT